MKIISLLIFLVCTQALAADPSTAGKQLFLNNCAACHGTLGDGRGPAAVAIKDPKPRNFIGESLKYGDSETEIYNTITNGVPDTAMPPWSSLSEADRKAITSYVHSLVVKRKRSVASEDKEKK